MQQGDNMTKRWIVASIDSEEYIDVTKYSYIDEYGSHGFTHSTFGTALFLLVKQYDAIDDGFLTDYPNACGRWKDDKVVIVSDTVYADLTQEQKDDIDAHNTTYYDYATIKSTYTEISAIINTELANFLTG